jgi:tetratricopeptide (TPR) repeat protein
VAESRRTLAIALLSQFRDTDVAAAREQLESALASYRALFGESHAEVAETELWLARATPKEDLAALESLLSGALAAFERSSSDDPRTIACANTYASFLQGLGRFDEAHAVLDRSAELTHKLFGDALATDMLRRYARLEFARGNPDAADAPLAPSARARARTLGRATPQRTRSLARARSPHRAAWRTFAAPPLSDAFAALRRIQATAPSSSLSG